MEDTPSNPRSVHCSDFLALFIPTTCSSHSSRLTNKAWGHILCAAVVEPDLPDSLFVSIVFLQIMLLSFSHETASYIVGNDEEPFGYLEKETDELGRLQKFTELEPSLVLVSTEMHY